MQWRHRRGGTDRVEQRQLAGRMPQSRGDLLDALVKHVPVAAVAQLLFLLEHAECQRNDRQREREKRATEEHAQAKWNAPEPKASHSAVQRKPRMGTFSI